MEDERRDPIDKWLCGNKIGIGLALTVVAFYFAYDTVQLFQKALFWTALLTGSMSGMLAPYMFVFGIIEWVNEGRVRGLKMLGLAFALGGVAFICFLGFERLNKMPQYMPSLNSAPLKQRLD